MNFNKTILSVTTNISGYGGAEKVMVDVHNGLKDHFDVKVLSLQSLDKVHPKYKLAKTELIRFLNPWCLNNKVLLVHARNLIPIFVLLKRIFFLNVRIIYVSHSVYDNHRKLTLFPKEVVSISNKVTENLLFFFNIPLNNISVINNGMKDMAKKNSIHSYRHDGQIRILYSARINKGKRQVEIIKSLECSELTKKIELHFAGDGEDYEILKQICDGVQFKALGFVENIHSIIGNYDYVMLFSSQEGLPLCLIEGAMHAKPLLVNDVGGNLEIGIPGKNGIYLEDDLSTLASQLNVLNDISITEYNQMSKHSRNIYVENFGYQKMINNYKDLLLRENH